MRVSDEEITRNHGLFPPEEPSLHEKILILETAAGDDGLEWAYMWTYSNPGHFIWMEAQELIITVRRGAFYAFEHCTDGPKFVITDKGRDFLAPHIAGVGEW